MKKPTKRNAKETAKAKDTLDKATNIAELVNKSFVVIKDVGIENEPLKNFWLSPAQRDVLLTAPGISQPVKTKLAKAKATFTHAEVAGHDTGPSRRRTRQRWPAASGFPAGRQSSLGTVVGGDDRTGGKRGGQEQEGHGQDSCWNGLPIQDQLAGHRASDLATNPDEGLHIGQTP